MIEYYKTLGLQEGASQEEIQEAYERLSKELNPSENGNTDFFIEEYSKIQDAYNALRNSSILSTKIYNSAIQKSNSKLDSNSEEEIKISLSRTKRKKYFGIALVIILLLSISAFIFYLYSPLVTDWYYEKGIEKYDKNDYKAAIPCFTKAIKRDPSKYIYFLKRAASKEELKDYKGAIKDYTKAIVLNPNNDSLYAYRGNLRCDMKDMVGGFSDFEKGLKINPKSSIIFENRAYNKAFYLDDESGAIKDLDLAILIFPSCINYYTRGLYKSVSKEETSAILDFTISIEKFKQPEEDFYAEVFYSRASCYYDLGNYISVITDCSKAIDLNKKNYMYYHLRGVAKICLNDFRGAIKDYTKCVKLNPKFVSAYFIIGVAYENLNNIDKACEFYSKAGDLGYEEAYERIKSNCN